MTAGYPATVCAITDVQWKNLWKNNVYKNVPKKYQKIVIRQDDDDTDSISQKTEAQKIQQAVIQSRVVRMTRKIRRENN